ncbi:MAG: phospholipid carrier-dependent glycosyltransferase [Hormoscilla sp.]
MLVLAIIWLAGAAVDRLWFALDNSVPAWDQADYLTGALNYWQILQAPEWFSGEWWTSFWMRSTKIPPLTYMTTVPFLNIFGTGPDQSTLVMLFSSIILLGSVYCLGRKLFNVRVALWAAAICQILPGLYRYRLDFLLDYPLTATVTLSFCCLTLWKKTKGGVRGWFWAMVFGLSLGMALLVKQTALFFLLTPILWVICGTIKNGQWGRIAQLLGSLAVALLVCYPWYRTNWLLILTSGKRATLDAAIAEGDPALNTLDAWVYYWKITPYLVSWPLLLVAIVGLIFYWQKQGKRKMNLLQPDYFPIYSSPHLPIQHHLNFPSLSRGPKKKQATGKERIDWKWLAVFAIGAYILCSVNINKDARYVLPYLPVLSLWLAKGLISWDAVSRPWGSKIRWGTMLLATGLMLNNLFPLPGASLTQLLSPRTQHYPYRGQPWPHQEVIDEIIKTEPYLRSTLGVLPSTPFINQHNFNHYGALRNFQVYGRQVGTQTEQVPQDARSLSWFVTKTGDQGSVPAAAQAQIVQIIEGGSDFQLQKSWPLVDGSTLKLYHKKQPPVQVQPVAEPSTEVQLVRVEVPEKVPPGVPIPVTYEWIGPWEELQSGLVLITWQIDGNVRWEMPKWKPAQAGFVSVARPFRAGMMVGVDKSQRWLHDHGIAMGALHTGQANKSSFQVIEHLAMLPPADLPTGAYSLKATYLNRKTGESYPIAVPKVSVTIDPNAAIIPASELDLVTQLRQVATQLPKGSEGLEIVFAQTGRINQYDPIQDYVLQADLALKYRMQQEPENTDWAYGLVLSKILQQNVEGAIAALKQVQQLDPQNPYVHAYLAFVYLYDWRPGEAEKALQWAHALNPNLPEIRTLRGIAALMQLNLPKAWHYLSENIS